jgi:hypothetical protein
VSELATDLNWWAATHYPSGDDEWGQATGRHAYNEDAALTPIFHALRRAGERRRYPEPTPLRRPVSDPVDEFRRDPLSAPIPTQAAGPRSRRREQSDTGRHHRTRETTRNHW